MQIIERSSSEVLSTALIDEEELHLTPIEYKLLCSGRILKERKEEFID